MDPHFASSDFYCAAVSALKLFNSLNSGSMSWDSRKETLAKHTDLLQVLSQNQVILLQECTEPEWFVNALNKQVGANSQSSFACISHKEGESITMITVPSFMTNRNGKSETQEKTL